MENLELKQHILSQINDEKVFNPIAEEAFNAVDTDQSKYIDKYEFKECSLQVAKGFGLGNPSQSAIEEIYNNLDTDGNGTIDLEEFKIYVKKIICKLLEEM